METKDILGEAVTQVLAEARASGAGFIRTITDPEDVATFERTIRRLTQLQTARLLYPNDAASLSAETDGLVNTLQFIGERLSFDAVVEARNLLTKIMAVADRVAFGALHAVLAAAVV